MFNNKFIIFTLASWLYSANGFPSTITQQSSPSMHENALQKNPIQIEAMKGIECDKNNKICRAHNAIITHNDITLKGSLLMVTFDEKEGIQNLNAEGKVFIESKRGYNASGQKGSFDLKSGIITLEHNAVANDLKNERGLKGDKIILKLDRSANGKVNVNTIEIYDNVEIKTLKEMARSNQGIYNVQEESISLTGNVRITNKQGQLNGDTAQMDLKKGISHITSHKGPVKVLLQAPKNSQENGN